VQYSYKDILLGKFSGECSNKKKWKIWKKIDVKVNGINPTIEQSVKDVQKRYKNICTRCLKSKNRRRTPRET